MLGALTDNKNSKTPHFQELCQLISEQSHDTRFYIIIAKQIKVNTNPPEKNNTPPISEEKAQTREVLIGVVRQQKPYPEVLVQENSKKHSWKGRRNRTPDAFSLPKPWPLASMWWQESGIIKAVLLKRWIWQDKAGWIGGTRGEQQSCCNNSGLGWCGLDRGGNNNRQGGTKKDQQPCDELWGCKVHCVLEFVCFAMKHYTQYS